MVKAKQVYNKKSTLIAVTRHYAVVKKFRFVVCRSSKKDYYLKCPCKGCSWEMSASALNKSRLFKIRTFCEIHTYSVRDRVYARRQGITDVVAVIVMDKYADSKTIYTPNDTIDDMMKLHGVRLTYQQAWRAQVKALKLLRGDPAESYARMPGYLYMLEKTYPDSVVLEKNEDDSFLYAFVALEACIRAWEYCRPIVVVDGAALKCAYRGTMLTASTTDPGGHILPLAYAIVDSENDASWTWFFEKFKEAYGEREKMCFMSDRNESIWKATSRVYPTLDHHACIWHLWCNVLKNFRKNTEDLRKYFFAMAKAYTLQEFEEIMCKVDTIDTRIRGYLFDVGYHKWARAHSTVNRTWTMTSNIAESLNKVNRLARRFPVVTLLDFMRSTIQTWIAKHNDEAEKTTTELTQKYDEMLKVNAEMSNRMKITAANQILHTVSDGPKRYSVCLRTRKCICGRFQLDEMPCGHAMAVIRYRSLHGEDYCSPYYSTKNYRDTYAIPVEHFPCESTWDIPNYVVERKMMPPGVRNGVGRPQTVRWKEYSDVKFKRSKVTCSQCRREGHNKKTCHKYPPVS